MAHTFSQIVDEVYTLDIIEQQELRDILDSIVSEARKKEILSAYSETREEQESGTLHQSGSVKDVMDFLHQG